MAFDDDDELEHRKRRLVEIMRNARPATPTISVNGDHNVINLHTGRGGLKALGLSPPTAVSQPKRLNWRNEILQSVRRQAGELGLDEEQLRAEACRVLGRIIVAVDRLAAKELGQLLSALIRMRRPLHDE